MQEIWKDIKGYEGIYQVSNLGRVKSLPRKDRKNRIVHGRILSLDHDGGKYVTVHLHKDRKQSTRHLHRIVAETFIPNPLNKATVNHIDEDKENNTVCNLEWMTYKENAHHGTRMERCYSNRDYKTIGKKIAQTWRDRGKCRAIIQYDLDGNIVNEWESIIDAAKTYNVWPNGIRCSLKDKSGKRTCKGYYWRYKGQQLLEQIGGKDDIHG